MGDATIVALTDAYALQQQARRGGDGSTRRGGHGSTALEGLNLWALMVPTRGCRADGPRQRLGDGQGWPA